MLKSLSHQEHVSVNAGDKVKFAFPLSDIEQVAQGGMDLMIFFKDGGFTAIRDFFIHKPGIIYKGREFEADEFLTALNDGSLEPEEGEEESQRQHDYDVMAALDGIDHLDGLDMTTDREFDESDEIQADAVDLQDGKVLSVASLDTVHTEGPELSERPSNPDPVKPGNPDPVIPSDPDPVTPDVPEPAAPVVGEAFSDEKEWNAYRKGEETSDDASHITLTEKPVMTVAENHVNTAPVSETKPAAETAQPVSETKPVAETAQLVAEVKAPVAESTQSVTETAQSAVETTQAVAETKAPLAGTAQYVAETRPTTPVTETVSRDDTPVAPTSDASSIAAATPAAETKAPETSAATPAASSDISETGNAAAEIRPAAPVSESKAPIAEAKAPETVHATETSGNVETTSPIADTEEPVAATPDPVEIPAVAEIPEPVIPVTSSEPLDDDFVAQAPEPMPLTITGTGNAKSAVMTMRAPRMMSAAPSRAPAAEPDAAPSAQADDAPVGDDGTTEPERYESEIFFDDGVTIVRVLKQGVHGHVEQTEDGRWMYILDEAIDSGDEAGRNIVDEGDQVMLLTKDAKGVQWPVRVIVHIKDDVPDLDIKGEENVETGHEAIGTLTYDFGADDWGGKMSLEVAHGETKASTSDFESPLVIAGTYGTLTINKDGSYSYKANPLGVGEEGGTDTFNFTITDADGDTASLNRDGSPAQLTFTTEKPEEPEAPTIPDVSEKNLPDGTDPDPSALTVNINIPDGFEIVSVKTDGEDHAGRIVQQDGKWVYILDKPIDSGDEQGQNRVEEGDRHTVIVQDQYGNQWELEVPVAIVDDAPVAVDDEESIDEGATEPVTGNVLDNDKFGADGRADDDSFKWNTDDLTSDGDGGYTLSYGSIVLNADGSYSYTLDNSLDAVKALKEGESLTETVTYTIKDKDGDTSTATLTITIKGQDNAITITPEDPDPDDPDNTIDLDTNNSIVTVYDGGLENGNNPEKPTATIGQFKIDAPDGLATISVNGAEIWKDGTLADETDRTFETDEGKLVITGYADGVLTYTFTLTSPGTHPEDDELSRTFTVSVTDTDGSEAEGTITVIIKDDEPIAEDDTNSIDEGAEEPITGDVTENDKAGADGFDRVELVADPEGTVRYGELTLNADGTYSYELDNDNTTVMALKDGETLTETYNYKIYDKDGDYTEATLTITINGKSGEDPTIIPDEPDPDVPSTDPENPDAHGAMIKVYEKHLPDGTSPDGDSLTVTGTMQVSAPDGLKNVKIGETEISTDENTPTELTIGGNTLKVWLEVTDSKSGVVHYEFTLAEEMTHPDAETLDDLLSAYLLTVTDYEGKTGSCNLHVVIVDDGPEISVGEGQEVEIGDEIVIPDFEAAFGADNGEGKSFTITIGDQTYTFDSIEDVKDAKGAYGQIDYVEGQGLVYTAWAEQPEIDWDAIDWDAIDWDQLATYYDEDGNFDAISFLKDQGVDLRDDFTFTITDADGDKAEATWSVDLVKEAYHGETDADEALKHVAVTASEKAIGDEVVISLPEGYEITEITEQPQHGTVSQNADGQWVYVLNHGIDSNVAMTMALGGNPAALVMEADSFKAIVKNVESGRTMPLTVPVHIHDAEPEIEGASETLEAGETVSGQVALDWGADDGESKMLVVAIDGQETEITDSATIQGKHGTLTMSIDGTYSYETGTGEKKLVMNEPVAEGLSLPAGNGAAQVSVNVDPAQYLTPENPEMTLNVAIMAKSGVKNNSGYLQTLTDNGMAAEYKIGDTGYTLTVKTMGEASNPVIRFDYGQWTVSDDNGYYDVMYQNGNLRATNMSTMSSLTISLTDAGGDPVDPQYFDAFAGMELDLGANTYSVDQSVIQFNASSPDYTAFYNEATRTVTISMRGGKVEMKLDKALEEGDEIAFDIRMSGETQAVQPAGVDEFTVYAVDADGSISEATLTFDVKEPPKAPEIAAITADEAGMGQSVAIEIPDGYTIVEVVEQGQYVTVSQGGDGWAYALSEAVNSGDIQGANKVEGADSVKLKVTDGNGHEWTIDVPVDIVDDAPEIADQGASVETGQTVTGNLDIDWGADNGEGKKLLVSNGDDEEERVFESATVKGKFGTLTVNDDGSYSYEANVAGDREITVDSQSNNCWLTSEFPNPDSVQGGEIVITNNSVIDLGNGFRLKPDTLFGDTGGTYTEIIPSGDKLDISWNGTEWTVAGYTVQNSGATGFDIINNGKKVHFNLVDAEGNLAALSEPVTKSWIVPETPFSSSVGTIEYSGSDPFAGEFWLDLDLGNGNTISLTYNLGSRTSPIDFKGDTLTLNVEGSAGSSGGVDEFTVKAVDADGDETAATLSFTVKEALITPEIERITADEAINTDGSVQIVIPEGFSVVEIVEQGSHGTVERQGSGMWFYRLNGGMDSGKVQGANKVENADSVKLKVTDNSGHEWVIDVPVDIVDDVPHLNISSSGGTVEPGNLATGTFNWHFGADNGPSATIKVSGKMAATVNPNGETTIMGTHGCLTLNAATGEYSYMADPNSTGGQDTFEITATDSDGDKVVKSITFDVQAYVEPEPPTPDPVDPETDAPQFMGLPMPITVDEGALDGGSGEHTQHGIEGNGDFTVCGDIDTIQLGEAGNMLEMSFVKGQPAIPQDSVTINGIEFTITGATDGNFGGTDGWQVEFSYKLVKAQDGGDLEFNVPIMATNSGGSTNVNLRVTIHDDPVADAQTNSISLLDLFHEAIDDDIDLFGKPEKPEEETQSDSSLTWADLLAEEADYDEIVLPGSEFETQAGTDQTGNSATTLETSVIQAGDDLGMLAAQHEVENV